MPTAPNSLRQQFIELTRERLELGKQRYGDRYMTGPSLLPVMAEEAADAFNYASMEAVRVAELELASDTAAALGALRGTLQFFGENVLRTANGLVDAHDHFVDFAADRMRPPAADEYRMDAWKTRLNLPEAVEELADFYVLSRLEVCRLAHQELLSDDQHFGVLAFGDLAARFAVAVLELQPLMPAVPVVAEAA